MITLGKAQKGKVGLDLPTLIDTRMLIQANSGGGKSWAIRKLLEESHGQVQQIVLDLEGEFSTLRQKYDFVLVGKNGDTPAQPKSAKLLARKLMELQASAICDLYELQAHERVRFVRLFLESLISLPKSLYRPVLVVIDEAHHFCPEKGQAESAQAVIDLVTRGRKRGLCAVLATQRLSKLHKDACAELLNKMVGRASLDIDRKRASDELGFTSKSQSLSLRSLRPGDFHIYGPAALLDNHPLLGIGKFTVGKVKTQHPHVGDRQIKAPAAPTKRIKQVLSKLQDLPDEADRETKDNTALRRDLADVRRKLTIAEKVRPDCGHAKVIDRLQQEILQMKNYLQTIIGNLVSLRDSSAVHVNALVESITKRINKVGAVIPPIKPLMPARTVSEARLPVIEQRNGDPSRPQQRLLDTLAQLQVLGMPRPSRTTLAVVAAVSPKSGSYGNNLGRLRTLGYVEYPTSRCVALTGEGEEQSTPADSFSSLDDLHQCWLRLVTGPQARILQAVIAAYPGDLLKSECAEQIGVSSISGSYGNNLGRLRTLGAIDYPTTGRVKASHLLFPEELQ